MPSLIKRRTHGSLSSSYGNGSSWDPGPVPSLPSGHPWYAQKFGPRLAFEKTGANWYENYQTWHRKNGKAFFLNYWYQTLMVVDVAALDLVKKMPDNYAAMSPLEFFAELYALYYDLDDPKRSAIPADVGKWFDKNVGQTDSGAPMPAKASRKRRHETIERPENAIK